MSHLLQKPQALIVFAEEETLKYAVACWQRGERSRLEEFLSCIHPEASVRQAHGLKYLSCLVEAKPRDNEIE